MVLISNDKDNLQKRLKASNLTRHYLQKKTRSMVISKKLLKYKPVEDANIREQGKYLGITLSADENFENYVQK